MWDIASNARRPPTTEVQQKFVHSAVDKLLFGLLIVLAAFVLNRVLDPGGVTRGLSSGRATEPIRTREDVSALLRVRHVASPLSQRIDGSGAASPRGFVGLAGTVVVVAVA